MHQTTLCTLCGAADYNASQLRPLERFIIRLRFVPLDTTKIADGLPGSLRGIHDMMVLMT